mgnify:CR=1 FL=1
MNIWIPTVSPTDPDTGSSTEKVILAFYHSSGVYENSRFKTVLVKISMFKILVISITVKTYIKEFEENEKMAKYTLVFYSMGENNIVQMDYELQDVYVILKNNKIAYWIM